MRKSTERALRWFLYKEVNEELFAIETRLARIKERGDNPPEEMVFEHGFIRGLKSALEEEVDNS